MPVFNLIIRVHEIYSALFYVFYIMNQSSKIKANVVFPSQLHIFINSFFFNRTTAPKIAHGRDRIAWLHYIVT